MLKRNIYLYFSLMLFLGLSACTGVDINSTAPISMNRSSTIAVLPFTNQTEIPQADGRAAAITEALLRTEGYSVAVYPHANQEQGIIPGVKPAIPRARLLEWARSRHLQYAMTGTVTEWRYKIGLDGEPVVGLTLELINVNTGHVSWTAVGSTSAGCRTALSSAAQDLIKKMLATLVVK